MKSRIGSLSLRVEFGFAPFVARHAPALENLSDTKGITPRFGLHVKNQAATNELGDEQARPGPRARQVEKNMAS
jgi:hypothetical protein